MLLHVFTTSRMDIEEIGYQESHSDNDKKQRRKEAHTQAEKKRRDSIRRGYDELAELVPACRMKGTWTFLLTRLQKNTLFQLNFYQTLFDLVLKVL